MRRKLTVLTLVLMGLVAGLLMAGAFGGRGSDLGAVESPPTAAAEVQVAAAAAVTDSPEELAELRDFARKLERLFQTVAGEVSPAVVLITAEKTVRVPVRTSPYRSPFDDLFGGRQPQARPPQRERELTRRALGSGCILDQEGHILTNYHVIAGADELSVKLANGRTFEAKVVGADQGTELAVIRIQGEPEDLPTVKLGDSDEVAVGQWVIAIGNPFGLRHTVSAGIVSATGRSGLGVAKYESLIQTDAAINPGNSGGPLVNLNCEVIGINTAIFGRSGNVGIGFAIPINMAKDIMADLLAGRAVVRGYLGVYLADLTPEMAEAFRYKGAGGALVDEVVSGSPADEAGLKAGDVLTAYDGREVENAGQLSRLAADTDPGKQIEMKVWRGGEEKALSVKVGNLAEAVETVQDWLGLQVQTLTSEMADSMGRAGLEGVLVADVAEGSPAGEHIRPGDVILSVSRTAVKNVQEYTQLMRQVRPGARVPLRVLDSGTGRARYILARRPPQ